MTLLEEMRQDILEEELFEIAMRADYDFFLGQIDTSDFEKALKELRRKFERYDWDFEDFLKEVL